MEPSATRMFEEAAQAAEVVARQGDDDSLYAALAQRLAMLDAPVAFTCARGSSDHAATYAKHLFETLLDLPVVSQPPSVVSIYGRRLDRARGALFLVISQSGRSPDLLLSARAARGAGALVVALVNDERSPLADIAEVVLPLRAGPEVSVAATKSYLASLSAIARLTAIRAGDASLQAALEALPAALSSAWHLDWSPVARSFASARGAFVLGRGATLGVAQEAALKFKETCGLHAEAFSIAEVAHGPMELVEAGFPVLVLPPGDAGDDGLDDLMARFVDRGARVSVAGRAIPGCLEAPIVPDLHPVLAPIALAQSFYRMVNAVAVERGRDPDRPAMLAKVTRTR
jgi:glucosamine--fructose-6-phosphate aminotransferase (isomerizing)